LSDPVSLVVSPTRSRSSSSSALPDSSKRSGSSSYTASVLEGAEGAWQSVVERGKPATQILAFRVSQNNKTLNDQGQFVSDQLFGGRRVITVPDGSYALNKVRRQQPHY
jgi:hypothetical protein